MHGPNRLLAPLLLLLCVPPVHPDRASAQQRWNARIAYEHQFIDSGAHIWNHWDLWRGRVDRQFRWGRAGFELVEAHRFNQTDRGVGVHGRFPLGPTATLVARILIVPGQDVLPEQEFGVAVSREIRSGWQGRLGYRFLGFAGPDIHLVDATVARTFAPWTAELQAEYTPSLDRSAVFVTARVRRAMPGTVDYVELTAGKGDRVIMVGPGPVVDISGSRTLGIRTRIPVSDDVGMALGLDAHTPDHWPGRIALSTSIEIRQ